MKYTNVIKNQTNQIWSYDVTSILKSKLFIIGIFIEIVIIQNESLFKIF